MTEKDHYKYGMDRKIDPSIPMLRARIRQLEDAIRWACGEVGDFPGEHPGKGRYHWRTELRTRAGVPYRSPPETEGNHGS